MGSGRAQPLQDPIHASQQVPSPPPALPPVASPGPTADGKRAANSIPLAEKLRQAQGIWRWFALTGRGQKNDNGLSACCVPSIRLSMSHKLVRGLPHSTAEGPKLSSLTKVRHG